MVRTYETETGYYEYVDSEGYARIGRKEQKYKVDRGFYGGGTVRREKVGVVDFYPDEDEDEYAEGMPDKRRECPHCLQYGVHNKLSGRILKKGEEKPVDYDQFIQCVSGCGNIFPVHEIEREKLLKADTKKHKVASEFDAKEGIVMSVPSRSSKEGKKLLARRRRERNRMHHKDDEIDREIQQHGEENIHVVYDSDP